MPAFWKAKQEHEMRKKKKTDLICLFNCRSFRYPLKQTAVHIATPNRKSLWKAEITFKSKKKNKHEKHPPKSF